MLGLKFNRVSKRGPVIKVSKSIALSLTWTHHDAWRHQMETFSALLAICAGNAADPDEFPAQRPVTRRSDVFFDLRKNKRLSKQSWGWWFETPSRSLWRHCNGLPDIETLALWFGIRQWFIQNKYKECEKYYGMIRLTVEKTKWKTIATLVIDWILYLWLETSTKVSNELLT